MQRNVGLACLQNEAYSTQTLLRKAMTQHGNWPQNWCTLATKQIRQMLQIATVQSLDGSTPLIARGPKAKLTRSLLGLASGAHRLRHWAVGAGAWSWYAPCVQPLPPLCRQTQSQNLITKKNGKQTLQQPTVLFEFSTRPCLTMTPR